MLKMPCLEVNSQSSEVKKIDQNRFYSGDALFFLHIPKTAGTSLYKIIERNFAFADVIEVPLWLFAISERGDRFPDEKFIKGRFISGHIPLRYLKNFSRCAHIITFLRNPVDLICSFFYFMQNVGHIPQELTIEDIIGSPMESFFVNPQTRWVAGQFEPSHLAFDGGAGSRDALRDPQLLLRATENLKQFAFVGITEQFELSVSKLCDLFSWQSELAPVV